MATPVYQWNPFQERVSNRVPSEIIKTATQNGRFEFVPRAAPFFSRNFDLRVQGSTTPLVLGTDYAFAHPFDKFILKYNRNVFGSVVLLKPFNNTVLRTSYDTIGGPFMLDDAAFATLVANIVNSPRIAQWDTLVQVPGEFPADPHDHPVSQTYDYLEMMTALRSLVLAVTNNNQGVDLRTLFEEHINKPLIEAHRGEKADLGLSEVLNLGKATNADLDGNSDNILVSMAVLKQAFRLAAEGKLKL